MASLGTIWPIEPHTQAKHQILRKYLQAWLPIMSSWNGRVLYIDGFAGPGVYAGGEPGSPMIALDAAINHKARISAEVMFIFIEADRDRAQHLQGLLAHKQLPPNFKYHVYQSRFDGVITEVLDYMDEQRRRLAPAFVLVDPFGYSHTPFDVIRRLFSNRRCELLITFMYQFINRFVSDQSQWNHLDRLYGTTDWRAVLDARTPSERRAILHGAYRRQLEQEAGADFVWPFEMEDTGGRTEYFLFFCTHSLAGLTKMKHAMWAVDPTGGFRYAYSANPNQLRLFGTGPDVVHLRTEITEAFRGKEAAVEQVEEFVLVNTPYLDTHYKRQVLAPMERESELEVVASPRKQRFAFPPGTLIRFR
jgi:three-Cys-motif partner protein